MGRFEQFKLQRNYSVGSIGASGFCGFLESEVFLEKMFEEIQTTKVLLRDEINTLI